MKNDIGFYMGDEDSVKGGGSVIYMPYSHSFLSRGNGHRVIISDVQLLRWYSRRRENIRRAQPPPLCNNLSRCGNGSPRQPENSSYPRRNLRSLIPATTANGTIAIPLSRTSCCHTTRDPTHHQPTTDPASTTNSTPDSGPTATLLNGHSTRR